MSDGSPGSPPIGSPGAPPIGSSLGLTAPGPIPSSGAALPESSQPEDRGRGRGHARRHSVLAWMPTWALISTKQLELRKRRGLMLTLVLLTLGIVVLFYGLRLIFHAVDPKSYGPAGSPGLFSQFTNLVAEFGFIVAAAVGASAGTTDLSDGLFRQLVITGRSRLSLFFARIPSGLSLVLPVVAVAFGIICLVTSYAGVSAPTTVNLNGANIPLHLDKTQLQRYLDDHAATVAPSLPIASGPNLPPRRLRKEVANNIGSIYSSYASTEVSQQNPPINEMAKIGLWLELEVGIGFVVGLGLGSLTGQRTVSIIVLIALELIITPVLSHAQIPYFIDGQRAIVGVAMDQLRPAYLGASATSGGGGPGHVLFGGRGALGIPPMPTWGMVTVIVAWIVGWTGIGAWRMATRDC